MKSVEEIELAIGELAPHELEELYQWLDEHFPQPIDVRMQSDIASGRLDRVIRGALDDEIHGRVHPM